MRALVRARAMRRTYATDTTPRISRSSSACSCELECTSDTNFQIESVHIDDRTPVVDPACQRRQRVVRGAGERIPELVIEIRSAFDQRVIDGVLGEREVGDVVAKERFDIATLEKSAQIRARAIEDPRQRETDPIVRGALEIADHVGAGG